MTDTRSGRDYAGRIESMAPADKSPDGRSVKKAGNRPMSSCMQIRESIRGHIVEN